MNEIEKNLKDENVVAEKIERDYVGLKSASATLGIKGNTATCTGNVTLKSSSYTVSCTMTLQKKVSGDWNKVTSWSSTGTISKTHSVTDGKTYRVRFHGSVKNSKGTTVDTFTTYSKTVTA